MNRSRASALLLVVGLASLPVLAACSVAEPSEADEQDLRTRDGGDGDADGGGETRADAGTPDGSPDGARDAAPEAGSGQGFVDPRDGQHYPTMKVGTQTWLARNLSFAIAGSSYCYGDLPASCASDGRLYPWNIARTACAPGWHLSTDLEWQALEAALGMSASQLTLEGYSTVRGTDQGTTLKRPDGFAARMAGFRAGTDYEARGDRTYFWTSTTRGADVWRRRIAAADATVFRFTNSPAGFAISVRCVMD